MDKEALIVRLRHLENSSDQFSMNRVYIPLIIELFERVEVLERAIAVANHKQEEE